MFTHSHNGPGHGHGHNHGHGHDHDHADQHGGVAGRGRIALRFVLAALIVAGAAAAACAVIVPAGEAVVVTRFGDPTRVLTAPGLAWKYPAPLDTAVPVDLRLRTTSTGLNDVGTREGLRVLIQAYVVWEVSPEPEDIRRYLRAVRNNPDEAAQQLRGFAAAALQVAASTYGLDDLVNTDPARLRLAAFEQDLRTALDVRARAAYGVTIREAGIERLTLPAETLAATVARMRAEREIIAAERTTAGLREASAIKSEADRAARTLLADTRAQAAGIEAAAEADAARIHADAFRADPALYEMLRSLDSLGAMVTPTTRLILKTDAAPFRVLSEGPPKP